MSGSRTVSIRLSVTEADQFRQAFTQAGLAGQSAMQTLTTAINATTPALHAHTQAAGLANYQIIELTESAHKFADIILSGGSAIRGLEFELPKFIGIAGGVSNALGAVGKAMPLLAIGAAAAGIYELGKAADEQQSRMALLGQQVRATRDDYTSYAKTLDDTARKLSQTTPISMKDARETINTIGTNPNFSGNSNDMLRLGKDAEDLSVVMKTSLADATKIVTSSLDNATDAAKKFEQQGIEGFTPGLVRSVELLDQLGKHSDATNVVLHTLEARTSGAAQAGSSPLSQALLNLKKGFDGSEDAGRKLTESVGAGLDRMAADGINAITHLLSKVDEFELGMRESAKRMREDLAAPLYTPADNSGAVTRPKDGSSALGLFQVQEGALQDVHTYTGSSPNLYTLNGNARAGMAYLNLMGSAGAYHLGVQGAMNNPAGAADYTAKVGATNTANLPTDAASAIEFWGNYYHMSPEMIDLGKHIAMQESGGHQYSSAATSQSAIAAPSAATAASAATMARMSGRRDVDPSDFLPPSSSMVNDGRKSDEDIAKEIEGTRAATSQTLSAELAKIEVQLQQLRDTGGAGSTEYMGLTQREQTTQAAIYNNVDPQTAALREGQRQLDSGRLARRYGFTPAGDQLAASMAQGEDLARTSGAPFTEADKAQKEAQFYEKAGMELTRLQQTQAAAVAGNERLAAAYAKGGTAVADLTAKNEALQQINLIMPPTAAAYAAAVDKQTASNRALARSLEDVKATQAAGADTRAAAAATEQARLLAGGGSQDQNAQAFAAYQARQANSTASPAAQDQVAAAAQQRVQAEQALANTRANYAELQSFGGQTFDRIGSSMAEAFTSGANAAKTFSSIAKSVITDVAQEFEKLAIINPLKNAIFGTSSPTLSSASGLLGSLLGSAGGATATASAAAISSQAGTTGLGVAAGIGGLYHYGGIVGSEPTALRFYDPATWVGAPRYHSGGMAGLASNEVPAVLQAGEAVLTPGQMAALSPAGQGGDTHFNFNVNAAGAGPREIDQLRTQIPLLAMQAVQSGMTRGGAFAKAVRGG